MLAEEITGEKPSLHFLDPPPIPALLKRDSDQVPSFYESAPTGPKNGDGGYPKILADYQRDLVSADSSVLASSRNGSVNV